MNLNLTVTRDEVMTKAGSKFSIPTCIKKHPSRVLLKRTQTDNQEHRATFTVFIFSRNTL